MACGKLQITKPLIEPKTNNIFNLMKTNGKLSLSQQQRKRHRRERNGAGLSRLQFAILVTAIATGMTSLGIAVLWLSKEGQVSPTVTAPTAPKEESKELVYNVRTPPNFRHSQDLQGIVDEVVNFANLQGLPVEELSITLIDLSDPNSSEFAGYRNQELRFPASLSKLFWMVALYAHLQRGFLKDENFFYPEIYKTIQKSDNEPASRILDRLTDTTSGVPLEGEAYQKWLKKRLSINRFFEKAGYTNINISQKNFPIPYLKLDGPEGRDLQMRGDPLRPIRNQITTDQAARLMYEIFTDRAVSEKYSQKMKELLKRDLRAEVWKQELYNSIEGFLGEFLPVEDVEFYSKVGWTSSSRQDAAFIASQDVRTRYILVIFGDSRAYAEDWEIFPEMSLLIFNRLVNRGIL